MQAQLQRVEVEPIRSGYDDLAVKNASRWQLLQEDVVQIGEVAIERAPVAALDEHVVSATKHERAKAVPFGFVQVPAGRRQLLGQLCQHRLDRGSEGG